MKWQQMTPESEIRERFSNYRENLLKKSKTDPKFPYGNTGVSFGTLMSSVSFDMNGENCSYSVECSGECIENKLIFSLFFRVGRIKVPLGNYENYEDIFEKIKENVNEILTSITNFGLAEIREKRIEEIMD